MSFKMRWRTHTSRSATSNRWRLCDLGSFASFIDARSIFIAVTTAAWSEALEEATEAEGDPETLFEAAETMRASLRALRPSAAVATMRGDLEGCAGPLYGGDC